MSAATPNLEVLLHQHFGHSAFRPNQEAVCRAATSGRDCLLVMPTGAGKSLCYQLPALARQAAGERSAALVISPLIALMDDQAAKLAASGHKVARIHSGLAREDARQACRDYLDGTLNFLFIAPERMRVPGFPEMLARRKPSLIAIDEAHCISAWGHDFRPDYRALGTFLPALRPAPIIALTATATPEVQRDIALQLALTTPALFIHGFRRDNLHIEVMELAKPQRPDFIAAFLADPSRRPAIVYAPSRKLAEELASKLGGRAAAYHAGLSADTRERVQRHFLSGKTEIVVATIAFGMGIDKADVRTVLHAALPASVEAYYQEIGRAGRDGKSSTTVLLYSFQDRKMHDFFLERDYPAITDLQRVARALTPDYLTPEHLAATLKMDRDSFFRAAEKLAAHGAAHFDFAGNVRATETMSESRPDWLPAYTRQVDFRRAQIDRMMAFAETQQCRMTALIRHFGDTADSAKPCGHCDFCAPTRSSAQALAAPDAAQDRDLRRILRTLAGRSTSTGKLFTELALTKDRKQFDQLLDGLARAGLLTLTSEQWTNPEGNVITFKKAALTHEGRELKEMDPLAVLLPPADLRVPHDRSKRTRRAIVGTGTEDPLTPAQQTLEAALRAFRKAEAATTGKPAFIVFGDSALHALVRAAPRTIPQLLTVSGFGPDKAERYGAAITAIIRGETMPVEEELRSSRPKSSHREDAVERPSPREHTAEPPKTFTRTRPTDDQPTLTPAQQALDTNLRAWRKSEAERLGLPQFFVLATSTLHAIVLNPPRTLTDLKAVPGIGPEKLDRLGPALIALCNI